jgi:protein gp37
MNRSAITWLVNSDGTPGYTWSPTTGCGPGLPCYARCWARAYHVRYRGGDFSVKLHPSKIDEPLRLKKPSTIGVSLMGELFHDKVPYRFIRSVFDVMGQAARHTFLVLTKQPGRYAAWERWLHQDHTPKIPWPWSNVWLGVSVEDQASADERIPILLDTPAAHRLVSLEPQVGAVDLEAYLRPTFVRQGMREPITEDEFYESGVWGTRPALNLVVQGCESGPRRRPFDVQWARDVRDACRAAGVPFALKQMPDPKDARILPRIVEKPLLDGRVEWEIPFNAK